MSSFNKENPASRDLNYYTADSNKIIIKQIIVNKASNY